MGKSVHSSPALGADGTIYVGADDNNLYAINPDGSQRWSFQTGNSIYSSPAIAADGTIYVGSLDNNLYAINPDGLQIWSFEMGGSWLDGVESSPAIGADGTVYVGSSDKSLYAINPDGTQMWSFKTEGRVDSSPALGADGTIYVGSKDKTLYAINPDGSQTWSFKTGGRIKSSPAIGADGTIYVGSKDHSLYAIMGAGSVPVRPAVGVAVASSPSDRQRQALDNALRQATLSTSNGADALTAGRFEEAIEAMDQAVELYAQALGLAPDEMRDPIQKAIVDIKADLVSAQHGLALQRYNAVMDSVNDATNQGDDLFEGGKLQVDNREFEPAWGSFDNAEERYSDARRALRDAVEMAEEAGITDTAELDATVRDLEEATLACQVESARARLLRAEELLEAEDTNAALNMFQNAEERLAGFDAAALEGPQQREVEYLLNRARDGVASCRIQEATASLNEGVRQYDEGAFLTALESYRKALEALAEASSYSTLHGLTDRLNEAAQLTQIVTANQQRATDAPVRVARGLAPDQPARTARRSRVTFQATAPTPEGQRLKTLVREIDSHLRTDP